MTIAFVNAAASSGHGGSNTSETITLPGSISAGNLLIAFLVTNGSGSESHTWPAGWTKFDQQVFQTTRVGSLAWRIATGSDTAPVVSWTGSATTAFKTWQYSGANGVSPIGAKSFSSGSTSPHSSPSITATGTSSLAVYFDYTSLNSALTVPSGWSSSFSDATVGHMDSGTKALANVGDTTGAISTTGAAATWGEWQFEVLGPTSFAMTGAGGAQVGGSSAYSPVVGTTTGSGGAQVGGSSTLVVALVPVFVGAGGVQVGGAADVQVVHPTIYNIALDGQPSGGAIAGGAATVQDVITHVPTGGAVAGGAAQVQDRIPFTASGGAVGSGTADRAVVYAPPGATTGAIGSGAAANSFVASITPTGGAVAGGSATVSAVQVSIYVIDLPDGGAVAGGAATITDRQSFYLPSGGAVAGGAALAYMVPAGFTPTDANPLGDPFPGWNVNFDTGAPARILGLPANSFARLNGVTYVANAAGVYALDAKSDAGSPIRARVLLPKSDAGSVHNKRVPAVWISGEMERGMVMQVAMSDESAAYYAVDPPDASLGVSRVEPGKGLEGRFVQLGFGNVQGADFTLESVEAPLSILKRHGR